MEPKKVRAFRLSDEVYSKLKKAAKTQFRSPAQVLAMMVERYIDEIGDLK